MKLSGTKITGWVLSVLVVVFMAGLSASGKFTDFEGKEEMFAHLGWSPEVMWGVGVVEVVIVLMLLVPQTAFVGAVLTTAYLGGAVATHVRVDDPYWFPIVLGVIVWVALLLRRPELGRLIIDAPLRQPE